MTTCWNCQNMAARLFISLFQGKSANAISSKLSWLIPALLPVHVEILCLHQKLFSNLLHDYSGFTMKAYCAEHIDCISLSERSMSSLLVEKLAGIAYLYRAHNFFLLQNRHCPHSLQFHLWCHSNVKVSRFPWEEILQASNSSKFESSTSLPSDPSCYRGIQNNSIQFIALCHQMKFGGPSSSMAKSEGSCRRCNCPSWQGDNLISGSHPLSRSETCFAQSSDRETTESARATWIPHSFPAVLLSFQM